MNDPNRAMKWFLVVGLVALSLLVLYPPREKLKGGIDLVGGSSLLFEIDTSGLQAAEQTGLSTRVMRVLKDRVDPDGQLNLEWRPVGNNKLEIRMPRPPREALLRREAFNNAVDELTALNISRFDVESALNAETNRDNALNELIKGVDARTELIAALVEAHEAYLAVQEGDDEEATAAASDKYEEAMTALLDTSLPVARLLDVLALNVGERRTAEVTRFREQFAAYDSSARPLLTKVVDSYDSWAADKADLEDPSDLKRRLRGAGVLEFRILADRDPGSPSNTASSNPMLKQSITKYTDRLKERGPHQMAGDRYKWLPVENILRFTHAKSIEEWEVTKDTPGLPIIEEYAGRHYVLAHGDPEFGLLKSGSGSKKWKLEGAFPDRDPMTGENIVSFKLDPRGGAMFGELTGSNLKRQLCIFLDGEAVSHATINERITQRCQISGRFTSQQVQDLVRSLEAGSLPARLKDVPLKEQTIGPSLGEANRTRGMKAAVWGGGAVLVFVLIYYGIAAGGMANVALALNLLLVLAIMALMQATFTLPGIAGLILTVGMAIDANVLIFERIREERKRGAVLKRALNAGYDKAFSTIVDANLTTLFTCVILGFVGSEEVKGFATVLGIGIVTSMFTSLFVTRLAFNTLIAAGMLSDLSMRQIVGVPTIDWMSMRRVFWPVSVVVVSLSIFVFFSQSTRDKESVFDIEFLGGTSVQVDLKPGVSMTDEEMAAAITSTNRDGSAVQWLENSATKLSSADVSPAESAGEFNVTAAGLSGEQLATLLQAELEGNVERGGIVPEGRNVRLIGRAGQLSPEIIRSSLATATEAAKKAAGRLRTARIQTVQDMDQEAGTNSALSFEVVTTETNRLLVQQAILAALGTQVQVQRSVSHSVIRDEELTKEPFFVVEAGDHYMSDVVPTDANFDIRRFRGGTAVVVQIDDMNDPITVAEINRRLREIALQPEFDQYRTRSSTVLPFGPRSQLENGDDAFRQFAVFAVDETVLYDDDPVLWAESLAKPTHEQVTAALGSEKSLSKVVQFAPQVAGQTRNQAIVAMVLAFSAIVAYLWLRFGTKEYGLAAIVALVHDVSITLGVVTLTHFLYGTFVGSALLLDDFRIDLPMVAALLTVVGYSLNDTIVVFDRIRENKGRLGSLSVGLINSSINQTLSRTVLTSLTTFLVVIILYVFGGKGIHGFSFALLIGVLVGTYSSVGVATPLLFRPALLHVVVTLIVAIGSLGLVFTQIDNSTARIVLAALIVVISGRILLGARRTATRSTRVAVAG